MGAVGPVDAAARIAVLPFESLSTGPDESWFARGFVEDLIVELSRFPALEVLHPDSSFSPADAAAAFADRGLTHVLRGSVRRGGGVLRVTARLVDADGRQCWADRFDAPLDDVLALQDEIVARVASALAIGIDSARLSHARRRSLASLEVYDCWLRGLDALHRGTPEDDARARTFFERALEIDPSYARAHAGLSLSYFNEWSCQAWERWDENESRAYEHACRAAALDDGDAQIQMVLARIHLYRRHFDEAERLVDRALAFNPSDADVLAQAGLCRAYLGDASAGVALAEKAMRLHPRHPDWYVACLAVASFAAEDWRSCCEVGLRAPRSVVDLSAYVAAAAALRGDAAVAARLRETFDADFVEKITFGRPPEPGEPLRWIEHVNPYRRREAIEKLAEGLRLTGLPVDPDVQARPEPIAAPSGRVPVAVFRRAGDVREIVWDGDAVRLSEVKGFADLAQLFASPGEEIHCLDLAGRTLDRSGSDPVLDERARKELGARIRELEEEVEDAARAADLGRAERARAELDALIATLSGALGLGGRPRRVGSAIERARTTVTWRIRSAMRKIAAAHPSLGRHLTNAVRTGTTCSYRPEKPVEWTL